MKNTPLHPDPIKAYRRKASAARRVGKNTRCSCGEARTEALIGSSGICAACKRKKNGHALSDRHHVAGNANSPVTVSIPVNDHRAILSTAQYDWPRETLENPQGDPLKAAAACIRGFIDTVRYLCDRLLLWVVGLLERLSDYLIEQFGPEWWIETPLEQFGRKG